MKPQRGIETLAVHAGRHVDRETGAVTPPIHLSSTFERSPDGEYPRGFSYSREDNPNRHMLEECLAALENGTEALAFGSGLAAVTAVFHALEPGDHILLPNILYYGVRKVLAEVFPRSGFVVEHIDMTPENVAASLRPETRLIWTETPSNPLLTITDLAAIGALARRTKAITVCDATFATPALLRPLEFEIDVVMHSTTKFIGGHSDVVGGALITRHPNYLFERARKAQHYAGAVPSPFDCWLILRGISTLPWRMRAHSANALAIAEWLAAHPRIEAVHYPGLSTHPQHELARSQMSAFGGMLSAQVRGGRAEAMAVPAKARLFTRATSLGGPHSFIEHRASIEGRASKTPQNLLRFSVGLETPEDLIADLEQALAP